MTDVGPTSTAEKEENREANGTFAASPEKSENSVQLSAEALNSDEHEQKGEKQGYEASHEFERLGPQEDEEDIPDEIRKLSAEIVEPQKEGISIGDNVHINVEPETPVISRRNSHTSALDTNVTPGDILFLKNSMESLISIKEVMKKHQDIVVKATTAIEILKTGELPPEEIIFEPLKLACEQSTSVQAKIQALDCLGKIFSFNLFTKPIYWTNKGSKAVRTPSKAKTTPELDDNKDDFTMNDDGKVLLIEAAINVVRSCFEGEATDERVELQIIKVLTGAVVNESMPVHGKVFLHAIIKILDIFRISLSPVNQGIAQASLIQIVDSVFEKITKLKSKDLEIDQIQGVDTGSSLPENNVDNCEAGIDTESLDGKTLTLQQLQSSSMNDNIQLTSDEIIGNKDELYVKDAFLVFRQMCKFASDSIDVEALDMRSYQVRTKLLSLHIIHYILRNYHGVFTNKKLMFNKNSNESAFLVNGIRKYLCIALSTNAISQMAPVYEVTIEIYWLMIKHLRSEFKFEIPVFLDEIYFPVSDLKTSTSYQKRYVLEFIGRLCCDPKILIEFYLNYDCDTTLPNICEKIVDYLARYALLKADVTAQQKLNFLNFQTMNSLSKELDSTPELNSSKLSGNLLNPDYHINFPVDFALKMISIECIVLFLQSLNLSCGSPLETSKSLESLDELKVAANNARLRGNSVGSGATHMSLQNSDNNNSFVNIHRSNMSSEHEDPSSEDVQFDTLKQRKTNLLEGIRLFNFSAKKGISFLDKHGFLTKTDPKSIAKFIQENDALDKTVVGEFLGGSKEENIAIMHAFVDILDFRNSTFLDALRHFLQHFRLPGESQVIDRFMLKFAEKYVNDNPSTFANADTVYVLSYSVIMLNTDQHSPQVKKRMTLDDFIKNNRGIDDGKDLDLKFLETVFNDIQENEIILHSEQQAALISNDTTVSQTLLSSSFFGRDYAREAYTKASKALTEKTKNTVDSIRNNYNKNTRYYTSDFNSNPDHVKSIFNNLWMSLLAGLTPPFKEYDGDEICALLLLGIKLSTHLSAIFELDYARTSFVRALVQFTNINNPEDMKDKNINAIYTLLEIAVEENSYLKSSWKDVFIVISQVERLRLLSKGVNSNSVPDLINARLAKKSIDINRNNHSDSTFGFFGKRQSLSQQVFNHHFNQKLPPVMINRINATELDVSIDKVFSKSIDIQGDGIFDFVSGLVEVASEEINSSGNSEEPRMFCLQKMVDVCYYNMNRIRLQWSEIWKVMNQEFNEFGCSSNKVVAFFAIDSLRQLSERFFNIEELSHFKFQKEFLKPFDYIINNNSDLNVREMVLDCINYLIIKKSNQIKSGWTTILDILTHVSYSEDSENFVSTGLEYTTKIVNEHMESIETENDFTKLVDCLCEYSKNEKFQKCSLRSLSILNSLIEQVGNKLEENEYVEEDILNKKLFPILSSFNNIIMEGNDLEVRSKSLNLMFESLINHGKKFDCKFWERLCTELLFPIFDILKRHGQINVNQNESLWVWLSSTLIQALRKVILLFATFFDVLKELMDLFLGLLIQCVCQDNDAISKIGISCLEDLIFQNMAKFGIAEWTRIQDTFDELFRLTKASELFELDPMKEVEGSTANGIANKQSHVQEDDDNEEGEVAYSEIEVENKITSQEIIIKCVLHLHMIQILSELFDNNEFYQLIPYESLIKLSTLLHDSYSFAKEFNENYNLRVRLWNAGIVDKLPNLLKQETSSVGVYISILFRLYCDEEKVEAAARNEIVSILIPLAVSIMKRSAEFQKRQESKNLISWLPVVVEILQAITELNKDDFVKACPQIYEYVVCSISSNMSIELTEVMRDFLSRVGAVYVSK